MIHTLMTTLTTTALRMKTMMKTNTTKTIAILLTLTESEDLVTVALTCSFRTATTDRDGTMAGATAGIQVGTMAGVTHTEPGVAHGLILGIQVGTMVGMQDLEVRR